MNDILCIVEIPIEIDFSTRTEESKLAGIGGQIWVKYSSISVANLTLKRIHNFYYYGVYLSVIFELGLNPVTNKRIISNATNHKTIIRKITRRNMNNKSTIKNKYDYSGNSIVVNNTDYPYPTGLYMTRLIQFLYNHQIKGSNGEIGHNPNPNHNNNNNISAKTSSNNTSTDTDTNTTSTNITNNNRNINNTNILIRLLTNTSLFSCNGKGASNKYAKEMTEAMCMVDNIERGLKYCDLYSIAVPDTGVGTDTEEIGEEDGNGKGSGNGKGNGGSSGNTNSCSIDIVSDSDIDGHNSIKPIPKVDTDIDTDINTDINTDTDGDTIVHAFVLGDGIYPMCTALIALFFPHTNWHYYSIDPLLEPIEFQLECDCDSGNSDAGSTSTTSSNNNSTDSSDNGGTGIYSLSNRFHQFRGVSQDFIIPPMNKQNKHISIVIACHSHAPMQEFWDRLYTHSNNHAIYKIAVSMNCCSSYCMLYKPISKSISNNDENDDMNKSKSLKSEKKMKKLLKKKEKMVFVDPVVEFDDYEVYSPKRTIRIYINNRI